MRELTEYEKQLIEVLIKENESLRMVIKDSQLQNADPLANTTLIVITLKDILNEIKALKTFLNIKTPSLAEESAKESNAKKIVATAADRLTKKKKIKPVPKEVQDEVKRLDKELTSPPPFVQFQLTRENIAKLFTKPEEARSVIVQKLLDAGCAIGIDKLVEMGYIENVRRYECRMKVNG